MNQDLQQFIGVRFDGLTNLDKFHDVDTPFAAVVFGDKRLRPTKAFGELVLCQAGGFARPDHQLAEGSLPYGMDRFVEFARASSHRRRRLIRSSDYPKKGYILTLLPHSPATRWTCRAKEANCVRVNSEACCERHRKSGACGLDNQYSGSSANGTGCSFQAIRIWGLIGRTKIHHDKDYDKLPVSERETTRVCIKSKDGSKHSKVVAHPRGTGPRALTNDEILEKYRSLTRPIISGDRQSAIEKTVLNIESVGEISSLVDLLAPKVRSALE